MRKTISSLAMLVIAGNSTLAQGPGLVKNGGFEELSRPVRTWDQLDRATGWSNANIGTCDLFDRSACNVSAPDNDLGTGTPAFEGERYAGFVAYKEDMRQNWKSMFWRDEDWRNPGYQNYAEYLQIELGSALVADVEYDISYRVRLANGSDRAVSGLGGYCSPVPLAYKHAHYLNEKPQVSTSTIVEDKQNWTEVKGTFKASGSEKFLVIGVFPSAGMEKKKVTEGADNQRAYYYIDGISVNIHPEPDTDGDGVIDKEDSCPQEKGVAALKGCPDRDGDGIADALDACPDKSGSADMKGCPDGDGDGIADNVDRCPNEKGVKAMNGCPELSEKTKNLFERALNGIKFETGKSVIKKESYTILNDVVKVMEENPTYNLEIHGHTDDQGEEAKNQELSDERAAAVKKFLTDKGVADKRTKSWGHGETQPVADNKTSAGRAINRRVEFKVTFWE
jgi:outer membrane protein OmpA-like peptidoglycan-associated protein